MTDYLQVSGHDDLQRHIESKAIINTNDAGYHARKLQKEKQRKIANEKLKDKERISVLENELSDIKSMLVLLLNK